MAWERVRRVVGGRRWGWVCGAGGVGRDSMSVSLVGVGGDGGGEGWGRGWKKGLVVHFMVAVVVVGGGSVDSEFGCSVSVRLLSMSPRCAPRCVSNSGQRQRRRRSGRGRKMSTDSASTTLKKHTHGEQGADSSPSSSRSEMSPSTPSQQRRHPGPPPRLWGLVYLRGRRHRAGGSHVMACPRTCSCDYQRGEFCSRQKIRGASERESLQDQLTSPLSLWHRDRSDRRVRERPKIRVQGGRISTQIQGGANHRRPKGHDAGKVPLSSASTSLSSRPGLFSELGDFRTDEWND